MTPQMEKRIQKVMVSAAGLLYVILSALATVPTMGTKETFEGNFTPWHPWVALFCALAALVAVHALGIVYGAAEEKRAATSEESLRK